MNIHKLRLALRLGRYVLASVISFVSNVFRNECYIKKFEYIIYIIITHSTLTLNAFTIKIPEQLAEVCELND